MNLLQLPLTCLLIFSTAFAIPVPGQQKRRGPEKPAVKTPAAPAPAPVTLDTLLAADSYKVYAEVRGVGQLIRSSAATDLLDPVLKLGGPPQDFVDIVTWLKSHADELMTSRLVVAGMPTFKEVPDVVVAIEMATAEDATKFEAQLNGVLPKILPPVTPQSSPQGSSSGSIVYIPDPEKSAAPRVSEKPKEAAKPVPRYYLQRANSLIVISPTPVQLKKLRPKGSKLFSEDANFRVAYNRFSSEPVFVFVNTNSIQKEHEERRKQYEEEQKKAEEAQRVELEKLAAAGPKESEPGEPVEPGEEEPAGEMEPPAPEEVPTPMVEEAFKEPTEAEILSASLNTLRYSLMGGIPDIPDAVGVGFSPENDSFDVRVLLVDSPGEGSTPIPFFPGLALGGPISPQSPKVMPADSELVLTMALDLDRILALLNVAESPDAISVEPASAELVATGDRPVVVAAPGYLSPLKTIEKILKINATDDLLPLLGSEVAVSLPVSDFNFFGPPRTMTPRPAKEGEEEKEKPAPRSPFIVLSLRDKEGMRRMMPRLLEGFAGKAAAALAQTDRREDTELVSIAGVFAYAFVGDFLVLSGDAATTRQVVDSYLKGNTLAADSNFRNYTRWQPHQLQGQVYISQALSETYRTWADSPMAQISDEARNFLTRLGAPQPITYSLSNDGLGALHELHVPKSFLLLTVASMASAANPPQTVKNERDAMNTLWRVSYAQRMFKEQKGSRFGSFEELVAAETLTEDAFKNENYKFAMTVTAEGFEISAVPVEYGKTGKLSFFIDQSGMLRGGDHGGAAATASDQPISG